MIFPLRRQTSGRILLSPALKMALASGGLYARRDKPGGSPVAFPMRDSVIGDPVLVRGRFVDDRRLRVKGKRLFKESGHPL